MNKVFFGGSRRISLLNKEVRERADNLINQGYLILVGDANGADRAMQQYLFDKGYRDVLIFCRDNQCRNNVGGWNVRSVVANHRNKDFNYYAAKDIIMSDEADYGFMVWDGKSKGTLNNVINLCEQNKKVLVYFSPERLFVTINTSEDVVALLNRCEESARTKLDHSLKVSQRVQLVQQNLSLAGLPAH